MASIRSRIGENMEDRYLFKGKEKDSGKWLEWNVMEGIPHNVTILTNTICQCTGLKDKNGKLIWENDIIHKPFYTDYDVYANSEAYTGRIQYEDGGWSIEIIKSDGSVCVSAIIDMIAYSKDIEHFEVIGNIFDNKELLESEE